MNKVIASINTIIEAYIEDELKAELKSALDDSSVWIKFSDEGVELTFATGTDNYTFTKKIELIDIIGNDFSDYTCPSYSRNDYISDLVKHLKIVINELESKLEE